ncbi:START domain-containing protein 10-like [Lineus longissimus]|uniref:START domain-containing protein 10-like n=1 Tax=Lineus longissimus TaxID=88925 RepID=UPI002B4F0AFE
MSKSSKSCDKNFTGLLMQPGEVVVPDGPMFDTFKEICVNCSGESGWKLEFNKSPPTKVWSKKNDYSSFKVLKGFTVFEDVTPGQLYDVIHDPRYRRQWDPHMIEGREICFINPCNDIGYYSIKSPVPGMKNRDFVTQRSWLAQDHLNEYIIMNHSVNHKSCPPKKEFVRGKSFLTGYYITPHQNKMGKMGCEFYYITQCDVGGQLPAWIVNMATGIMAPRMFKKLNKVAAAYPAWKKENEPNWMPWRDPSQIENDRINYDDVDVQDQSSDTYDSLDETNLAETDCDLNSLEIYKDD